MKLSDFPAAMRTGLDDLTQIRKGWSALMPFMGGGETDDGRLEEVAEFGDNPGALRMLRYVPPGLPPGAPLVVVLHGCTQTASGYDRGTGWSVLAQRHGFAVLFPEQARANNHNTCFNWF